LSGCHAEDEIENGFASKKGKMTDDPASVPQSRNYDAAGEPEALNPKE